MLSSICYFRYSLSDSARRAYWIEHGKTVNQYHTHVEIPAADLTRQEREAYLSLHQERHHCVDLGEYAYMPTLDDLRRTLLIKFWCKDKR